MRHGIALRWSWLPLTLTLALLGCPPAEHVGDQPDAAVDDSGTGLVDANVEGGVVDSAGMDAPPGSDAATDSDSGVDSDAATDSDSGVDSDAATDSDSGVDSDAATGSDATTGADATPECQSDRQCDAEEICEGGSCVAGCRVPEDCPLERRICDTSVQPHGACVQCLESPDCQGPGAVCVDGSCTRSCSQSDPCTPPAQCDTDLGYCVRCIEDIHCQPGFVCTDSDCVEGCRDDSNCPLGEICENLSCIAGCRTTPTDTCPENYHCGTGSFCEPGCGTSDDQCPDGESCVDNACYAGCSATDECPNGQHCDGSDCVPGCWDATHSEANCGLGQVCDQSDGACVECYTGDTSVCTTTSRVCDDLNRVCVIECSTGPGTWACENMGWVCDTGGDNLCVECLVTEDCADHQTCNTTLRRCEGATGRGLCEPCQADTDCGTTADLCANVQYNFATFERVCTLDCSTGQTCPQGTSCQDVGDPVVRGRQCLPASSVAAVATCKARIDTMDEKECNRSWDCGLVSVNDAICSGYASSADQCSVICDPAVANDCPEGFVCEDPPPDGNRDPDPRCGPG